MLPAEFMADVLTISMRRLSLRLADEKADFDISADKYHIHDTHYDRNPKVVEGLTLRRHVPIASLRFLVDLDMQLAKEGSSQSHLVENAMYSSPRTA